MIINYLKIAIRNIVRHKGYSLITIASLVIGLTTFLVIVLYLKTEMSYDQFHQDLDRIYRVGMTMNNNIKSTSFAINVPPLAPALKKDFTEVQYAARVFIYDTKKAVQFKDEVLYEDGFVYADPGIFSILTVPFLEGDARTALDKPGVIVIPERLAIKYFPSENALGKTMNVNGRDYTITGVIPNASLYTHLPYDMFLSMADLRNPPWMEDWTWPGMATYVILSEHADKSGFEDKLKSYGKQYYSRDSRTAGVTYEYFLQPVSEIYLSSPLEYEFGPQGSIHTLYVFGAVGLFVLLIACMNYMNLSTARSLNRAKEVGVRKVTGAVKSQLITQFLLESVITTLIAAVVSVAITTLSVPILSQWLNIRLNSEELIQPGTLTGLLVFIIAAGLLAGSYPAFILSSFKPVIVLKNFLNHNSSGLILRKVLVVTQFTITISLFVCTIIILQQLDYLYHKPLGFDKEKTICIPISDRKKLSENGEVIKNEFKNLPAISDASLSSYVPGQGAGSFQTKLMGKDSQNRMMSYYFCDYDYLRLYNIRLVCGRYFEKTIQSDVTESCLINQSSVKAFGWSSPDEAIGQNIETGLDGKIKKIIGVTEDFHYRSAQFTIEPLVIENRLEMFEVLSLSVSAQNHGHIIRSIQSKWKQLFPDEPFQYYYIDRLFDQHYQKEEQVGKMISLFTLLGILISSLGILGLSAFINQKRTKEIGVRKVLGASVPNLFLLLTKDFIQWILLGACIACPLAYMGINDWLNGYPYRIDITVFPFAAAVVFSLVVSIFTISFHTMRIVRRNPIASLRYE